MLPAACTPTAEDYRRMGDEWDAATKNRKVSYRWEDFIASPNYRTSRDYWRGKALEQYNPANSYVVILLKEQRGRISEKKREHRSSRYGCFVDANDNLVRANVTSSQRPPAGAHFKGSKMDYWMRFNGAIGLHVGNIIERTGQSHGCVRLPEEPSAILFSKLEVGSRVIVK